MKIKLLGAAIVTALMSQAAVAEVSLSGFGSVKAGKVVSDDYIPGPFGYTSDLTFKNETMFAVQAQAPLDDDWKATLMLQSRGEDEFDVTARWAYLSYQYSPSTSITIGRFATPHFRHSETQDIGFSHNYARQPKSVYRGDDFEVIEGVRVVHNAMIADGDLTFTGSYGRYDGVLETTFGTVATEFKNIIQASVSYNYDWLTLYAGALVTEMDMDMDAGLDMGLMATLPGYTVMDGTVYNPMNQAVYDMEEAYVNEEDATYMSVGFSVDYNNFLLEGEFTTADTGDTFIPKQDSFYVAAGYRFDDITATFLYQDRAFSDEYASAQSSDAFVNAYVQGVSNLVITGQDYSSQGVHIRYDLANNVAFKAEYTMVNGESIDEDASIATVGIDFIF